MSEVLIVDDDGDLRECLREIFTFKDYEVYEASNGAEALTLSQKTTLRLIITDIDMPVMNGIDFLKQYRKLNSSTPVAVMTGGHSFPEDYVRGLRANSLSSRRLPIYTLSLMNYSLTLLKISHRFHTHTVAFLISHP